jgi:hypothetical protein
LNKKEITASWEKIETANLAELRIAGFLYEFSKQTVIHIIGNQKGCYRITLVKGAPNYAKKIEYKIGDREGEAVITEDDFQKGVVYLDGIEERRFDALRWGFAEISLDLCCSKKFILSSARELNLPACQEMRPGLRCLVRLVMPV